MPVALRAHTYLCRTCGSRFQLIRMRLSLKVSDTSRYHAFRNIANMATLADLLMLTESVIPSLSVKRIG